MTRVFNGHRKLYHIKIAGKKEKLIPIYLHSLNDDSSWADLFGESKIMNDVVTIVVSNIEEIEEKNRSRCRMFSRLTGDIVTIMYVTTTAYSHAYQVLNIDGGMCAAEELSSFSIIAWICCRTNEQAFLVEERAF